MFKHDFSHAQAQIVYFSHGGGPLPLLGDASHQAMVDFMVQLPVRLRKPDAILVISAHWEESAATLLGSPHPPMYYDYYGFPEEAYQITYSAPGNPGLAKKIVGLLNRQGVPAGVDSQRGFDHGLFIPLQLMYPQAEIPSLQLSLLRGLDPAAHIALGKALRELRAENILVIGSGFSFHNLGAFSSQGKAVPDPANDAFHDWLIATVGADLLSHVEREHRLARWQQAPSARYCHPREEHLLPLQVCVGLADKPGQVIFDDYIMGKRGVAFLW